MYWFGVQFVSLMLTFSSGTLPSTKKLQLFPDCSLANNGRGLGTRLALGPGTPGTAPQ